MLRWSLTTHTLVQMSFSGKTSLRARGWHTEVEEQARYWVLYLSSPHQTHGGGIITLMSTVRGPELGKWRGGAQARPVVPWSPHSFQGSALPLRREDRNQKVIGDTWGHSSCPAVRVSPVQVCSLGNLVRMGVALLQPNEPAEPRCFVCLFVALEKSWFVWNLLSASPCIYLGQLWPQTFLLLLLFIYLFWLHWVFFVTHGIFIAACRLTLAGTL